MERAGFKKKRSSKSKQRVKFAASTKEDAPLPSEIESTQVVAVELDSTGMFFRPGTVKQEGNEHFLAETHQVFLKTGGMNDDESLTDNAVDSKNRWGGLQSFIISFAVAAVLLVPLVLIVQVVLMQNFVFTTDYLTAANVPFYDDVNIDTSIWWRSPRVYDLWWFLVAFGLLRIITVLGPIIASYETAGKLRAVDTLKTASLPYNVMIIFEAVYGLLELFTAIFALWVAYIPSLISFKHKLCAEVQLCRDPKTSAVGDSEVQPAYLFQLFAWFTLAFTIVHLVYFFRLRAAAEKVSKSKIALDAGTKALSEV